MKNYLVIWSLLITGVFYLPAIAQESRGENMLVVINGKIVPNDSLNKIPEEKIKTMHFLTPGKAVAVYGIAGAHGALLLKTQTDTLPDPIVLKGGKRIPADSLQGTSFHKIDVIRGRQAVNLYGPAGKNDIFVVHPSAERISALIEVLNERGRPLRGAAITNTAGDTIAVTNKCGQAYLEDIVLKQKINITHKRYLSTSIEITDNRVEIILEN